MMIEREVCPDYVTLHGLLGSPLQIAWLERWVAQGNFPRDARWLVDNRTLDIIATTNDARRLIDFFLRHQELIGHARIAVVAPGDAAYGMGRVLEGWAGECAIPVRTFREVGEAHRWLVAGDNGETPRACA